MKKYESLKANYPERISLNQLYQICRISKRSARYLLKNGVIPCIENSGNKTWRYSIAIDDVITYLRRREQWGSMISKGMANNARKKKHLPPICTDDKKKVISYFRKVLSKSPDVFSPADISAITGLHVATVRNHIMAGKLQALSQHNKYAIPKSYLLDYLVTQDFLQCKSQANSFHDLLVNYR